MSGILFAVKRTFALALESALAAKGWTPYKLAQEAGVARSALSGYLSGQDVPKDQTISTLAEKLGANEEELLALADVARLGSQRIARMLEWAPDAFTAADPLDEIQPPLSDLERPVARRILELNGGTWEGLNLNEYELLGVDRLAFFKDRLSGLERVGRTKKRAKAPHIADG